MIKNASELKDYTIFRKTGLLNLHRTLTELLNCEVCIEENPIEEFSSYIGIDLTENIKRYVYVISENQIVFSIKVIQKPNIIAILPILLTGKKIGMLKVSYLEQIGSALSMVLSECYAKGFRGGERLFYEYLSEKIISFSFGRGEFNVDRVSFIIQYLKKLCLTTFENENFSTGFIVSNSIHDYEKERQHVRNGILYSLQKKHNVFKEIRPNRRLWYLADGVNSFYLLDHSLQVKNLYVIPETKDIRDMWSVYSMKSILWGSDIAFRVINHNQISIINSDGIEFISTENTWKLRDYNILHAILAENSSLDKEVISCILYYVMDCSKNNKSVIMWLPKEMEESDLKKVLIDNNRTITQTINIVDERNEQLVKRILTSDGVTVINNTGEIVANGCVVNLSKLSQTNKLVGTGESAARLLAENGFAIKISQDGSIKIFYSQDEPPYIF